MRDISLKYFWKKCNNFGQSRWQYSAVIPVEFHQNPAVIPDVYLWNASKIPVEYLLEIPAFFKRDILGKFYSHSTQQ